MSSTTKVQTRQELIDSAFKKAGWDMSSPDRRGQKALVDGCSDPQGANLYGLKQPLPFLPTKILTNRPKNQTSPPQQREAERQAEHLFQSLLHRTFWGEMEDER